MTKRTRQICITLAIFLLFVVSAYAFSVKSSEKYILDNRFEFVPDGGSVETSFLAFDNNSNVMNNEHRFADENASWVYGFKFEEKLTALMLDLTIKGQYGIETSSDGKAWVSAKKVSSAAGDTKLRVSLTEVYGGKTDTVYVRFYDTDKRDGFGADLWMIGIEYSLENGKKNSDVQPADKLKDSDSSVSFIPNGKSEEMKYYLQGANDQVWDDGNPENYRRYADNDAYWEYLFRIDKSSKSAKLIMEINGEYLVKASDGVKGFEVIAHHTDKPVSGGILDITDIVSSGTGVVTLRFEDAVKDTGFGCALWEFELNCSGDSQIQGPVKNAIEFQAMNGATENRFMKSNNSSAIDRINGYRYADMSANWVYGFAFYDIPKMATLKVRTGGEYRISISANGTDWTGIAVATGRPDLADIHIDVSQWLSENKTKNIYVKFADRSTEDGFGARLADFRMEYVLTSGQPDTALSPIK